MFFGLEKKYEFVGITPQCCHSTWTPLSHWSEESRTLGSAPEKDTLVPDDGNAELETESPAEPPPMVGWTLLDDRLPVKVNASTVSQDICTGETFDCI